MRMKRLVGAFAFGATILGTIVQSAPAHAAPAAISGLIGFQSTRVGASQDFVANPDGTAATQIAKITGLNTYDIAWSPDGTQVAFSGCCTGGGTFQIYTMNVDGTGFTQLTTVGRNTLAAWAPFGFRIAFMSNRDGNYEIYTMNTDGSSQVNVSNNAGTDQEPAWSPDGSQIVWDSNRSGKFQIDLMKSDGTFLSNLSNSTSNDTQPSYASDGSKIAFESDRTGNHEIFTMAPDGTGQVDITNNSGSDDRPAFAPDSQRIAFDSTRTGNGEIFTMDASGSNQVNVTNNSASDLRADWQPVLLGNDVATIGDTGFSPTTVSVKHGDRMEWDATGAADHSASDFSSIKLFGSGLMPSGGTYGFVFYCAGIYKVIDSANSLNTQTLKVNMSADPLSGTLTTTFTITWASITAPSGIVYDNQIKRPGSNRYVGWLASQTVPSTTFVADAGVGTYLFESRLHSLTNGGTSGYSPPAKITVTG
jgi:Tol biopolymer transport system component